MNEQIKMTDGELTEVRTLQDKFQQKTVQLGLLYLHKLKTERALKGIVKQEDQIVSDWDSLEKAETDLINKLLEKYGEGSLDLQSGTFIVEKKT